MCEARYHVNCHIRFINDKQLSGLEPLISFEEYNHKDVAFDAVIQQIRDEMGCFTSISLHQMYESSGGHVLNQRKRDCWRLDAATAL